MLIKSAEFVKSSAKADQCPPPDFPEYAFIGRSNVGKSSVINMLTGKKNLAKTSSTPGKTKLINHFLINKEWYLVDLPGYGYARAPEKIRRELSLLISHYIEGRSNLVCLFLLIDIRHSPLAPDIEFMESLGEKGIPFVIVFTKCDKLTASQLQRKENAYLEHLKLTWETLPQWFRTSSLKVTGKNEILEFIDQTNAKIKS
jgi:GTP-binding protein